MKKPDKAPLSTYSLGLAGITHGVAFNAFPFAIRGKTKEAAPEWAPFGLRVNAVHPGLNNYPK